MMTKRLLATGLTATIAATGLTLLPAAGANAADTVYKACANKQTGAMRLVVKGKKCKKSEKKLSWNVVGPSGQQGPIGPQGPKGEKGDQGPAGAFEAVDQTGAVIGTFLGFWSTFPLIRLPSGVALLWSGNPADPGALPVLTGPLYYRQAGCTGDAFAVYTSSYPFDLGIILSPSGAAGAAVFHLTPGTPQAFTALSKRDASGCSATSTAISNAFVAKAAGTVPAVAQPLYVQPK